MFEGLDSLTILELISNPIRHVGPEIFHQFPNLERLWLVNTSLTSIPPNTFASLTHLSMLNLEENNIQTLERNIFASDAPDALDMVFSINPLQCDSRLCWIKEAEQEGWLSVSGWDENVTCVQPPDTMWDDVDLDCGRK